MRERTNEILSIQRTINNSAIHVADVLISEGSTRNFHLMEYDYIKLDFTLKTAKHFRIGDYIDDPIFGKFVLTSEQMPAYNQITGGFDYSLRFDAYHYLWQNKVFMLTANNEQNTRVRKETDWCLTDKLSVHLDEVIHNLTILGYSGYSYEITAEKAAEVRFLEYNGVDIITALKMIAEAWETEWWVVGKVIHLGKCEGTNAPYLMELGVNVESMDIRKNVNEYANKIFAFGGTQNLPFSYRKDLVFEVDGTTTSGGMTIYGDSHRPITPAMVDGTQVDYDSTNYSLAANSDIRTDGYDASTDDLPITSPTRLYCDDFEATIGLAFSSQATSAYIIKVKIALIQGGRESRILAQQQISSNSGGNLYKEEVVELPFYVDLDTGIYQIATTIDVMFDPTKCTIDTLLLVGSVDIVTGGESKWCNLYLESDTNHTTPYKIWVNPLKVKAGQQYYGWFKFDSTTPAPSGFGSGSRFTLDGLKMTEIPSGYYTTHYNDPSSLAKLGEVRLELPESTGGYVATSGLQRDQIVERVVIFNDEFPHAVQMVTEVDSEIQQSEEKQQDGTSVTWAWVQYHLKATLADGNTFTFNTDYISDGIDSLQIKFMTREELLAAYPNVTPPASAEYRLAGMTFNVNFDNLSQTYTIVPNTDFGAKLPNETLKPNVGDPFVLIGWNVKAMESLGLIATAESKLESVAREYLSLMEQDQFNFANTMMSDWMFNLGSSDSEPFYTSEDKPLYDDNDYQFFVKMGDDYYILPLEGTRVTIKHNALSGDKTSRIIGYELKLDKPYDSPRYDVGETDAYSRLKQIEKQLTKY